MRKCVARITISRCCLGLQAQDCVDGNLGKLPGKWTAGMAGAIGKGTRQVAKSNSWISNCKKEKK